VTLGSSAARLHLVRALGGGPGLLAVGTAQGSLADFPVPGMTTYIDLGSPFFLVPFVAAGAPGVAGAGQLDVPINVQPGLVGFRFFHQAFGFDAGAVNALSASNALEILYGP
jgi:hypothetical protein